MTLSRRSFLGKSATFGAFSPLLARPEIVAAIQAAGAIPDQVGAIDHLPDPPGSVFASDRITKSKSAYPLGIPDGILGLTSYGATSESMVRKT